MSRTKFFLCKFYQLAKKTNSLLSTFVRNLKISNSQKLFPYEKMLVPDSDHVLRYIRPTDIDQGTIVGSGFLRREKEPSASVNWLECFDGNLDDQVTEIRRRARIKYAKTGMLARLNVGEICKHVAINSNNSCKLKVVQDPLPDSDGSEYDPSHALIEGIPSINEPEGEFIGDLIAECLIDSFPTR